MKPNKRNVPSIQPSLMMPEKRTPRIYRTFGFIFFFMMAMIQSHGYGSYDYKLDSHIARTGQFESEISNKLERGTTNILYGWTEIFRTPVDWSQDTQHGFLQAVTIGLPYGAVRMVGRTVVGVYEVATCYAPQKPIFAPIEGDIV